MSEITIVPTTQIRPPRGAAALVRWLRGSLFSSPLNIGLTALVVLLLWSILPPLLNWIVFNATWTFPADVISGKRSPGASDCAPDGACWIYVRARIGQLIFGFYPEEERWRVILSMAMGAVGIYGLLAGPERYRKPASAVFFVIFPVASFWLLRGGLGLVPVSTDQWGGFMLTMVIAFVGIVLSLPFGILLALGRCSNLPIVQTLCVTFIEFVRGVPLITVIFMANVMLPLFLPPDTNVNVLLRVLVGTTAFQSAYMAEAVRGGLQAIPKGQSEAANALGLGYWRIAASAAHSHPWHRQHVHRLLQGYDPRLDGQPLRLPQHGENRI